MRLCVTELLVSECVCEYSWYKQWLDHVFCKESLILAFSSPPYPYTAEISPASATSVSKRDSALSDKVPTSQSFEWKASPDPSPYQDKHKPRPPSSSPIYEAIPEQLTLQASGGGKVKDNPNRASLIYEKVEQSSKPYAHPRQPQPPVLPVYKRGLSKKGVSPEKSSRLAPIGGVTKLNPLLDEQNKVVGDSAGQGDAGEGEAELPTQAVSARERGHVSRVSVSGRRWCNVHGVYGTVTALSPLPPRPSWRTSSSQVVQPMGGCSTRYT